MAMHGRKREEILEEYRQTAGRRCPAALPVCHFSEEESLRKGHERIKVYLLRMMALVQWPQEAASVLVALFDENGCLLDLLRASEEKNAADLAGADQIRLHSRWGLRESGVNAVSVGLAEGSPFYSVGDENDCALLKNYAVYFMPLNMDDLQPPYGTIRYGGVALLTPAKYHRMQYMTIVTLIVHDLLVNLQFAGVTYELYNQTGDGVIAADSQLQDKMITVTYCNQTLFKILGIAPMDLVFQSLEKLIDPLPKNRRIWAAFYDQIPLHEENLMLSVQGKSVNCSVTARIINQPGLNVRSVNFFISTPQSVSAMVSSRMGNSAVRTFADIVGESPALCAAVRKAERLADTDSNVLILGESGVGKDIFAQAIHKKSSRRNKPFIAVNCGALPRELIASELFGYVGGAFTGANRQGNIGKFELANGGTIFLDEIGEMPLDLQATLLHAVEHKQITRLGCNRGIDVDVKIISATNADIPKLIKQRRFRPDLYFRLSTTTLNIPPLRERGRDVVLLAEYFLRVMAVRSGSGAVKHLSESAKQLVMELPWVGNVRELENVMESIVYLYPDEVIQPQQILENVKLSGEENTRPGGAVWDGEPQAAPRALQMELPWSGSSRELEALIDAIVRLYPGAVLRAGPLEKQREAAARVEKTGRRGLTDMEIQRAAEQCGNNRSDMARLLGVSRATLYRYLKHYEDPAGEEGHSD